MSSVWAGPPFLALVATSAVVAGLLLVLGYVGRLRLLVSRHFLTVPLPPGDWPRVDVIVPVYNERRLVDTKIRNLLALHYPRARLRFWIVDGGSDDGTQERVEEAARHDGRIKLIRSGSPNKVWQLSSALKWGQSEWVLVSDADAALPAETLRRMITEGVDRRPSDPSGSSGRRPVLAVGSTVKPMNAHPLETLYWRLADRLRLWESRCGCASIVTGPCYLFRRALLDGFPEDVIADDVFVALSAAVSGGEIRYVDLKVEESRCPQRLGDLYRHKVRKADAYLREVFRFLPRRSEMTPRAREIFTWRAANLVVTPLLSLLAAGTTLAWVAPAPPLGAAIALALALILVGAIALAGGRRAIFAFLVVPLVALLSTVVLVALIKHPFSRQTANYPKIATAPPDTQEDPIP